MAAGSRACGHSEPKPICWYACGGKNYVAMRVGLIGGGNISETHARAAREIPGLEIVAVYGTNREKVARMSTQHGASPDCDFAKFLAHRPMDFVAIGSPSGFEPGPR